MFPDMLGWLDHAFKLALWYPTCLLTSMMCSILDVSGGVGLTPSSPWYVQCVMSGKQQQQKKQRVVISA